MAAEQPSVHDISLYSLSAVCPSRSTEPYPPGTMKTASWETVDNDIAALILDAGVVR